MWFGLLGPLEVRVGEKVAPIRSPKHRILLAALLLDAGRQVRTGRLVEAVWGSGPPDHPHKALQIHITRLRSILDTLSPGSAAAIVTCSDGYLIDVAAGQLDLLRFRRRLREADRAAQAGDAVREATTLAGALAEWRGDPLADVPSELLRGAALPWLEEQRLRALERRLDVDLRLGRHAAAVSELVALTGAYPLRERLWELLLTALAADDRRSDALTAYEELRRRLIHELGIEPNDELQRLHVNILTGGRTSTADTPAGRTPVPRQLPPDVRGFTGRHAQMTRLNGLIARLDHAGGPTLIVIAGTAGVGKTALAVRWARRVADTFPDGQVYLNLRGYHPGQPVTTAQALNRMLRALGVPDAELPSDRDEQISTYRSLMDGRRMLLVLDNARSSHQVRALLPGAPGSLVVVTSRDQLIGLVAAEGAELLTLEALSTVEAHAMLAERLGTTRLAAAPDATADIIAGCARLPLALALIAASAATRPEPSLDTLARELHRARRACARPPCPPRPAPRVREGAGPA
ncbi:hypothetical protein GCM10012284_14420 [Mangrovihabitans endophyticus]|uniref:OmpR/PhoB-type domain-containing protein n=1 Tax=Mangrovihabitans endophyticus TaxID=1751298 RepID=A0A8J3BVZ1_9ACTN|nr:hypothetical protein GCM10012284_14420 [Mangrovihabitans endophyticus]